MTFRQDGVPPSQHDHSPFRSSNSPPPYERFQGQTRYYNVRSLEDLPTVDQNNRPIRYYNINDPNDRPPIDAQYGPIHYYRIIEPDRLPSIDNVYPSIEFDDPPHDSRPESDSLRGNHEPGVFNYAPYRRQSSPYFDAIEFPDDHRGAREASFGPIEFENRSYPDNMTDTRGRHETYDADHACHMRRLRQQSPYFDPIELDVTTLVRPISRKSIPLIRMWASLGLIPAGSSLNLSTLMQGTL